MTNQEARKVTYDKCPVKCASCEEECDSTAVGACRHNLEAYLSQKTTLATKKNMITSEGKV